jgi:hypothetical protein
MANGFLKISSKSLVTREMQIKTMIRNYLIAIRMDIIKNDKRFNYFKRCGENRTLAPYLGNQISTTITENTM